MNATSLLTPLFATFVAALVASCSGPAPLYPPPEAPAELAGRQHATDSGATHELEARPAHLRVSMTRVALAEGRVLGLAVPPCEELIAVSLGGDARVMDAQAPAPSLRVGPGIALRVAGPTNLTASGRGAVMFARVDARPVACAHRGAFGELDLARAPVFVNNPAPPNAAPKPGLRVQLVVEGTAEGPAAGSLAFLEAPPPLGIPEHTHEGSAEALYVTGGTGTMGLRDEAVNIGGLTTVYVPAGDKHSLLLSGTEPLRAIQIYAPSGPEQRFRAGSPLLPR